MAASRLLPLLLLLALAGGPAAGAQDPKSRPVEALLQDLGSKFGKGREQAARELAALGPAAAKAVPDLVKNLGDAYEPARVWAAVALSRIDPKEKSGVGVLLKTLAGKNDDLRFDAAKALGAYDASTPGVVDGLVGLLGDPAVGSTAVAGLVAMGEPVLPFLLKALEPAEPRHGGEILKVVRGLGPAGIPVALSLLDHPRREIRRTMARWLAKDMDPEYPPAVHFLLKDLADPATPAEKVKAAGAAAIDAGAAAVPGLAALLGTSPDSRVHVRVIAVLRLLGPVAAGAVPALRTEALEVGKDLRDSALQALAAIDPEAATRPSRPWSFPASGIFSLRPRDGAAVKLEEPVAFALEWLARHQSPSGAWESAGFGKQCQKARCEGAGLQKFDAGVSGLAVLAFLGAGQVPGAGRYGETVRKGIEALCAAQDKDGCVGGNPVDGHWIFNHAVGTMALCEASAATGGVVLGKRAQDASSFVLQCQNPYLAWSYGIRPQDNDTAATGWMLLALRVAQESGMDVDPAAFDGGKAWFDKVTEPEYGRAGYKSRGDPSPRYKGWADYKRFPAEAFEGTTAMAVLGRILAGADREDEYVKKGLELLLKQEAKDGLRDFHCMHFTALAMFQEGGDFWKKCWWTVERDLRYDQRSDRSEDRCGSWDPVDPWSHGGGRVYATAINALTLETPYRYARFRK
jgi:HEAT repeat protein